MLYGVTGKDKLFGEGGDDSLYGGSDDDYLNGGNGSDILHGGKGADTIIGGVGNDTLKGNRGKDVLVLDALGDDRILDFKVGEDKINLTLFSAPLDVSEVDQLFDEISSLTIASLSKRETQITYSNEDSVGSVALVGVRLDDLSVSDFIFYTNTDLSGIA